MYRVLIVDDEQHVLDWIHGLLTDLERPELDVYKAGTATDALAWLDRCRIDIVVSDISMPGMTGIELHEKIRARWPECKVIFLTGYTDFEYAYQAVKNEAVGYILKTEDDDVIVATVLKAVSLLEESTQIEQLLRKAEERSQAAIPLLRNEYLSDVLRGEAFAGDVDRQRLRELDVDLNPDEPVWLIATRLDERKLKEGGASQLPETSALSVAIAYVGEALSVRQARYAHLKMDGNMIWLVQSNAGTASANLSALLLETFDDAQRICFEKLGGSLSSVVTDEPVEWERLADKYAGLRQGLARRLIYESGFTVSESGALDGYPTSSQRSAGVRIERGKWEAARACLEEGQREPYFRKLREIESAIAGQSEGMYGALRDAGSMEAFGYLALPLLSSINRWELRKLSDDAGTVERLTNAERHRSWRDALAFIRETATAIFDLYDEKRASGPFNVIQRVQEEMRKRLHEGVSLIDLAESVFFSPSYLSRLFKETCGESITSYLARLRLERAIEMLRENRKINDIAAAVGLEAPAYFSRFFKKMTGRTPQEYREEVILAEGHEKSRM